MLMITVKAHVGPSEIPGAGQGLIADEDIYPGTIVWRFREGIDRLIPLDAVANLSKQEKEDLDVHAYRSQRGYVFCDAAAQMMNHAQNSNTIQKNDSAHPEGITVARKFIPKGREINCNYFEFDGDATTKIPKEVRGAMAKTLADIHPDEVRILTQGFRKFILPEEK